MQKPANCGATHRPIAPFGRGGEGQLLFLRPRARDRRAVSLRHSEAPEHYQSAIKLVENVAAQYPQITALSALAD